jgi:hypothetical protein
MSKQQLFELMKQLNKTQLRKPKEFYEQLAWVLYSNGDKTELKKFEDLIKELGQ